MLNQIITVNIDKIYISIVPIWSELLFPNLKLHITLTYETWLEWQYVAISMISGGSRSFAKGEG